jgi:hypothetical protein
MFALTRTAQGRTITFRRNNDYVIIKKKKSVAFNACISFLESFHKWRVLRSFTVLKMHLRALALPILVRGSTRHKEC